MWIVTFEERDSWIRDGCVFGPFGSEEEATDWLAAHPHPELGAEEGGFVMLLVAP